MVDSLSKQAFTDVNVWAVVTTSSGEQIELDITSCSMSFKLNSIPTARFKVAIGTNPNKGLAEAHVQASKIEKRNKVEIHAKLSGSAKVDPDNGVRNYWDGKDRVIFSGYINRPLYNRGVGAASLSYEAVHWLSDLAITSKLSSIFHPRSPGDIFKIAVNKAYSYEQGSSIPINLDPNKVNADLWGNGVKEAFTQLVSSGYNFLEDIEASAVTDINKYPLQALKRMDNADKIDLVPLALKNSLQGTTFSGKSLEDDVVYLHTGYTVWDTILSLVSSYQYAVVPNVESATIAPLCVMSKEVYKTISASEYSVIDIQTGSEADLLPLRAVKLYNQSSTYAYVSQKSSIRYNKSGLVGNFDISEGRSDAEAVQGQVIWAPAPMKIEQQSYASSGETTKTLPIFQNSPPSSQAKKPEPRESKIVKSYELGNALAHAMYISEVFNGRTCSISGRLRFDIAPGSCIRLETVGHNIPYYNSDEGLWGVVDQVTCTISAENGTASTNFNINGLNTAKERGVPNLVVTEHPLYNSIWVGTELLKGIEVEK